MTLKDFDYALPEGRIARYPCEDRDGSRLMVVHMGSGRVQHRRFRDLPECLGAGDCLVLNESRVIPARLLGVREGTGGRAELLLAKRLSEDVWEAMARPGRRLREGDRLVFGGDAPGGRAFSAEMLGYGEAGSRFVRFSFEGDFMELLEKAG
ncbi:MAG: S-adenosylmethionine:tRNA ribosyltransferase-isomerase, partial [Clostridiales Family XIII bacterium]|nr:S-adenosylmethionine:tRNA ribosyltransferase-isomerase [Clostridiales Family XIII bacterium]